MKKFLSKLFFVVQSSKIYSLGSKLFLSKLIINELSEDDLSAFNDFLIKNKEAPIGIPEIHRTYFIARTKDSSRILGYVMLHRRSLEKKDFCILYSLVVTKMKRRQHIGTQLVKEVIGRAKQEGFRELFVSTSLENKPAQSLYSKLGFAPLTKINTQPEYIHEIKTYFPKEMIGLVRILN